MEYLKRVKYKIYFFVAFNICFFGTIGYIFIDSSQEGAVYEFILLVCIALLVIALVFYKGFYNLSEYFIDQLYIDELTGLHNRKSLTKSLDKRNKNLLILSNIRHFSVINELYGNKIGNEVLKKVGEVFKEFATKNNFEAFRISSDEFVLLRVDNEIDIAECNDILEDLYEKIANLKIKVKNLKDYVLININSGVTFNDKDALENAQMALKKAKDSSLPYLAYSNQADTKENIKNNIYTRGIIKNALEQGNVKPFFQPITDRDGCIIKYESLIRILDFTDGVKKIIFPDDFLELSKQNGQYSAITKEMIKCSLSTFLNREEKISINLTPSDLFNVSIMDTLKEYVKKFDNAKRIIIEITEQEGIKDFKRLVYMINRIKSYGVLIAIDDFGSGYANYSHVLTIKPDYVKIDGSLIKNLQTDRDSQILVKSIVSFAKDLNILTIAEYVENEDIYNMLKEYGVDEFQGYYFSKPLENLD